MHVEAVSNFIKLLSSVQTNATNFFLSIFFKEYEKDENNKYLGIREYISVELRKDLQ